MHFSILPPRLGLHSIVAVAQTSPTRIVCRTRSGERVTSTGTGRAFSLRTTPMPFLPLRKRPLLRNVGAVLLRLRRGWRFQRTRFFPRCAKCPGADDSDASRASPWLNTVSVRSESGSMSVPSKSANFPRCDGSPEGAAAHGTGTGRSREKTGEGARVRSGSYKKIARSPASLPCGRSAAASGAHAGAGSPRDSALQISRGGR